MFESIVFSRPLFYTSSKMFSGHLLFYWLCLVPRTHTYTQTNCDKCAYRNNVPWGHIAYIIYTRYPRNGDAHNNKPLCAFDCVCVCVFKRKGRFEPKTFIVNNCLGGSCNGNITRIHARCFAIHIVYVCVCNFQAFLLSSDCVVLIRQNVKVQSIISVCNHSIFVLITPLASKRAHFHDFAALGFRKLPYSPW